MMISCGNIQSRRSVRALDIGALQGTLLCTWNIPVGYVCVYLQCTVLCTCSIQVGYVCELRYTYRQIVCGQINIYSYTFGLAL